MIVGVPTEIGTGYSLNKSRKPYGLVISTSLRLCICYYKTNSTEIFTVHRISLLSQLPLSTAEKKVNKGTNNDDDDDNNNNNNNNGLKVNITYFTRLL